MSGTWKRLLGHLGYDNVTSIEHDEYDDSYVEEDSFQTVRKLERKESGRPIISSVKNQKNHPSGKVHVIEPKSFNDAQKVADKFKTDTPIIVNLQNVEQELAKRIIDFASGLTYARNGAMQRVADKVFLLTPASFDVSTEEKRMLWEKGLFFNQY